MKRAAVLLLLLIAGLLIASIATGEHPLAWSDLLGGNPDAQIVLDLRLPRALLALLTGMGLGVAGAIAQAILRNPLADPGILGINAGAALAALLLIVIVGGPSIEALALAGFAGAAVMAGALHALSWRDGTTSTRIILIGIGLTALAGGATTSLTAFGDIHDVQRAMIWLAGSVYHADWRSVQILALWLAAPLALALVAARELDLIRFGDAVALSLGQRGDLVRGLMIVLCTLLSGAAVAAAGLIGFVGLVAPHMARHLVGPSHARLIPTAALIGAALVMAADLLGRSVLAPAQLPAGIMTALIGAPFFGYLLLRQRHAAS